MKARFSKIAEMLGARTSSSGWERELPPGSADVLVRMSAKREKMEFKVSVRARTPAFPASTSVMKSEATFAATVLILHPKPVHVKKAGRHLTLRFALLLAIVHRRITDALAK